MVQPKNKNKRVFQKAAELIEVKTSTNNDNWALMDVRLTIHFTQGSWDVAGAILDTAFLDQKKLNLLHIESDKKGRIAIVQKGILSGNYVFAIGGRYPVQPQQVKGTPFYYQFPLTIKPVKHLQSAQSLEKDNQPVYKDKKDWWELPIRVRNGNKELAHDGSIVVIVPHGTKVFDADAPSRRLDPKDIEMSKGYRLLAIQLPRNKSEASVDISLQGTESSLNFRLIKPEPKKKEQKSVDFSFIGEPRYDFTLKSFFIQVKVNTSAGTLADDGQLQFALPTGSVICDGNNHAVLANLPVHLIPVPSGIRNLEVKLHGDPKSCKIPVTLIGPNVTHELELTKPEMGKLIIKTNAKKDSVIVKPNGNDNHFLVKILHEDENQNFIPFVVKIKSSDNISYYFGNELRQGNDSYTEILNSEVELKIMTINRRQEISFEVDNSHKIQTFKFWR